MSKYPQHTGPGSIALRALIRDLIDYAGLFPPASLSMKNAVGNYKRYLEGEFWWATGVFIVPASRLREFEDEFIAASAKNWCLSILVGPNLEQDVTAIRNLVSKLDRRVIPAYTETKVYSTSDIKNATKMLDSSPIIYFEVPLATNLDELLSSIKTVKGRAKLRTGGITSEAFPPSEAIARFLHSCNRNGVAFKATAGLHHPIRCIRPLTYDTNAAKGMMHGFINLFLASVFCRQGASVSELAMLLEDNEPNHFRFESEAAYWRDQKFTVEEIEATREEFARTFGSCSFEEPIEDLKALNLL